MEGVISITRLSIEYTSITKLFEDKNVDTIFYILSQTFKSLTPKKMICAFILGRRNYVESQTFNIRLGEKLPTTTMDYMTFVSFRLSELLAPGRLIG